MCEGAAQWGVAASLAVGLGVACLTSRSLSACPLSAVRACHLWPGVVFVRGQGSRAAGRRREGVGLGRLLEDGEERGEVVPLERRGVCVPHGDLVVGRAVERVVAAVVPQVVHHSRQQHGQHLQRRGRHASQVVGAGEQPTRRYTPASGAKARSCAVYLWLSDAQCVHAPLSLCVGSCVCGGPPCLCPDSVRSHLPTYLCRVLRAPREYERGELVERGTQTAGHASARALVGRHEYALRASMESSRSRARWGEIRGDRGRYSTSRGSSQCRPCVTHAACTELWYGTCSQLEV